MKRMIVAACILVSLTGCGSTAGTYDGHNPTATYSNYVEFKTARGVWCVEGRTTVCDFDGFNAQEDK